MTSISTIEEVVCQAQRVAIASANAYLKEQSVEPDNDILATTLSASLKKHLREGLDDARVAAKANMWQVANETFKLSAVVAGIEAAKEMIATQQA